MRYSDFFSNLWSAAQALTDCTTVNDVLFARCVAYDDIRFRQSLYVHSLTDAFCDGVVFGVDQLTEDGENASALLEQVCRDDDVLDSVFFAMFAVEDSRTNSTTCYGSLSAANDAARAAWDSLSSGERRSCRIRVFVISAADLRNDAIHFNGDVCWTAYRSCRSISDGFDSARLTADEENI